MSDLSLKPYGPYDHISLLTSAAVNKARNEGNKMTRSSPDIVAMAEIIGRHLAASVTGNNQPHMSGDPRNRIQPVRRRHFDEACQSAAEAICASLTTTTGSDAVAPVVEPVAWRYKCQDGSEVLMLKRLTDEQKRRGYYTGEDGEDEVDGDEAIVGPFHWAEETPLYAAPSPEPLSRPAQTRG